MYTLCTVVITNLSDVIKIVFKSSLEKTSSIKESLCTCYRVYPEAIFLHNEREISFRVFCKGQARGEVTTTFTIPNSCDSTEWHNLLKDTGLDTTDFIHSIIDCLNKTANIIDFRHFCCLLPENGF